MLSTLLGLVLLIAIPAEALWRTGSNRPPRSRIARYKATILRAFILLGLLLVVAFSEDVSAVELGLSLNIGLAGWIGLGIAVVVSITLGMSIMISKPTKQGGQSFDADNLGPEGKREFGYFLVMSLVIGFAWEVLYRGFLLWWLVPLVGIIGAVVLSGISYGLAHGWKNKRQGIGSIVSALLFAIAYALTGSLWWLILIHIAMPLVGFMALRKQRLHSERTVTPDYG